MASLLELSNELLDKICRVADCEDLKALSAINRRLYLVSNPILGRYRQLWAKFERLRDRPETARWFYHHLACSVLTAPGASFIRHIDTGYLDQRGERGFLQDSQSTMNQDWDFITHAPKIVPVPQTRGGLQRGGLRRAVPSQQPPGLASGCKEILGKAVDSCGWLDEDERHELRKGLRTGEQAYIRALLLPQLPNLRTLKIRGSSSESQYLLEAAVRQAAIDHFLNITPCEPFGKLTSVDFSDITMTMFEREYSLKFLATFMALPNLRKITTGSVHADIFIRPVQLPPPHVTEIAFRHSDISDRAFESLLAGGTPLVKVKLAVRDSVENFDDGLFGKVLLANARDSLEELELMRGSIRYTDTPGIDLREFHELRDLKINYESIRLEKSVKAEALSDVLPSSLQVLHLHTVRHDFYLASHALKMLAEKEQSFPHLTELAIESWVGQDAERALMEACKKHLVRWKVSPKFSAGYQQFSALQLPIRQSLS